MKGKALGYAQPFASARLSSFVPVRVAVSSRPKATRCADMGEAAPPSGEVGWLLSGEDPRRFVAVALSGHWIVNASVAKPLGSLESNSADLVTFLAGGRYAFPMRYRLVVREPKPLVDAATDGFQESYVEGMDIGHPMLALSLDGNDLVTLVQRWGNMGNPNFREVLLTRRPRGMPITLAAWTVRYPGVSARSPVLSNGTIAVWLEDGLRLVSIDGKELAVKAALLPGLVSVDGADRIWGFTASGGPVRLVAFDARGEAKADVPLASSRPVQPPVLLADGSMLVVTAQELVWVKDGKVQRERRLAPNAAAGPLEETTPVVWMPGQDPLATATQDGILLKHGSVLSFFGAGPDPVWELAMPDGKRITSNVLVTSDGGVYVAAGREIFRIQ